MLTRRSSFGLAFILLLPLGMGGCPLSLIPGEAGDAILSQSVPHSALPAGRYWIEAASAGWTAYALPARGEAAQTWLLRAVPEEYEGAGWYEQSGDGSWALLSRGEADSFDNELQLHDPRPAVTPR
jgi:hypothetical protein